MSAPDSPAPSAWRPAGAWDGLLRPGRIGNPGGAPGVVAWPARPLSAATIAAAPAGVDALAAAMGARYGVELPRTPRCGRGPGVAVRWTAPGQWLVTADEPGLAGRLAADLAGLASVTDQGSARAVLRLSGVRVRDVLAKGVVVDLDPRVFRPGDVALTVVAHMAVHLVRLDEGRPDEGLVYELSVARSLAGSFWRWFVLSSEEYGALVLPDGPGRGDFACPGAR